MEGKLAIGANAAVDHRSSGGIATHVVAWRIPACDLD
jgi:hypothetical protein